MNSSTASSLTVVVLAWNESRHLRACFKSLEPLLSAPGTESLVIYDTQGDATTLSLARELAGRVVLSDFVNFSVQRNRALDAATTSWVFFVDADERGTPGLASEIVSVIASDRFSAYRVPRRNFFFGHEVRHAGWFPDYQVRLLSRQACRYDEARRVHELPLVQGETGTLQHPLVHFNYDSWSQFLAKQRAYSRLDAQALYGVGRKAGLRSLVGQPLREFKRRFLDYEGYKDGPLGLALSLAMMLYTAETYRRLLVLQSSDRTQT